MELTATGTPAEVSPLIARARQHGQPVHAESIGAGRVRVTVGQGTPAGRPTPDPVTRPRRDVVPDVTRRPALPGVIWAAGGTGAVALTGGVVTLLVIDPAMLAILAILAVLGLIGIGKAVSSVKSAFGGE